MMKKKAKFDRPKAPWNSSSVDTVDILKWAAVALFVILLILVGIMVAFLVGGSFGDETTAPAPSTDPVETTVATDPTEPDDTTVPEETEPRVMLEHMAALYERNPDIVAWIQIEDTTIDYPIVFTPDDPEEYLRKGFDGGYSFNGTLFIDGNCSMTPESDNLIIYGHNMGTGAMFGTLMKYKDKSYWAAHPEIQLTTLYEERTYEIVAAFYDRVYYAYEDVFKFYRFIDANTEEEFQEAMDYYKKTALYDTGVRGVYGDKLITLVTCSYHQEYGRFVVVAREVPDQSE